MKTSICSFAFHRGFFAGTIDSARYVALSRELGATHLHFWLPHLLPSPDLAALARWDWRPDDPAIPAWMRAPSDHVWLETLREQVAASGLAHEMLAMEKGYAWHPDPGACSEHRAHFRAWVAVAATLGIPALRIDPGVARDPDPATRAAVFDGYREAAAFAADHGVRVFVENHWGASQQPAFLVALLEAVPELGYLLGTWNFADDAERSTGWHALHRRAAAVHVKTRAPDAAGHEARYPLDDAVALLVASGYAGVWGIESYVDPAHCDETEAVRRTQRLIRRHVADA